MNLNEESTAIRNRDLIFAECIKMLTDPVVPYFVLITLVLNILLSAIDASGMTFYTGASSEPSSLSSFGVVMFAPIYAFLALPVYAAAGEYRDGQLSFACRSSCKTAIYSGKVCCVALYCCAFIADGHFARQIYYLFC